MEITQGGKVTNSYSYGMDGQIATATAYGSSSAKATGEQETESFIWDGLALLKRDTTEYVNEPAVTGGNPILANGKGLFNDMLGTTLGKYDGKKFIDNQRTSFGSGSESGFFTGKPHIAGLGYAFLFRNYRPGLGKWQTKDPLGYPDGLNNLAYVNNRVVWSIDWLGAAEVNVVFVTDNTVEGDAEAFSESGEFDHIVTNISNVEEMVQAMETIATQGDTIKHWGISGHGNNGTTGAYAQNGVNVGISSFTQAQINRANACLATNAEYTSYACQVGLNEAGLANMANSFTNLSTASGFTGTLGPGTGETLLDVILNWWNGTPTWFTSKLAE